MVISGNGGRKIILSKASELENLADDIITAGQKVEDILDHIDEVHQLLYERGEGNYKEMHRQIRNGADSQKESMGFLYRDRSKMIRYYNESAERENEMAARAIK